MVSDRHVFLWLARINLDCKDYYLRICVGFLYEAVQCVLLKPGWELTFLGYGFPLEFLMGFQKVVCDL